MKIVSTSYESTGRTGQKQRTRALLVDTVRRLLADGVTPSVDQVAKASGVSRSTTYRYFPDQRALLLAAHPDIDRSSILGEGAPTDVRARLEAVLDEHFRILVEWEPQLRASLRVSLEPGAAQPPLRGGRAIGWIEDALRPLGRREARRLAIAIRAAAGIEPYVWLTDIAGLSRRQALVTMRATALTLLDTALATSA
jgi:AcrR family transcriptional regulator